MSYLHRDQLGSLVLVTNAAGGEDVERIFAPFGEQTEYVINLLAEEESFGFIGERLDEVAGLQYLNARYYDPELGLFIQPDWFDVRLPGVGTNRYAYSGNDPINLRDPNGNNPIAIGLGLEALGWFAGFFGAATPAEIGLGAAVVGVGVVTAIDSIDDGNSVFSENDDWVTEEEREIEELETIDAPGHNQPRPELEELDDDELMETMTDPQDGDRVTVKGAGKTVLDGNGRVKEAQRRGLKGKTPVEVLREDELMAPWEN